VLSNFAVPFLLQIDQQRRLPSQKANFLQVVNVNVSLLKIGSVCIAFSARCLTFAAT
jgi:collagenase-like PrtC family protease